MTTHQISREMASWTATRAEPGPSLWPLLHLFLLSLNEYRTRQEEQSNTAFRAASLPFPFLEIRMPKNQKRFEGAEVTGDNQFKACKFQINKKSTQVQKRFTSTWARTRRSYGLSCSISEEVYLRPSCQYLSRRRLQSLKPKGDL